jgi:ribosomal protein L32E
VKILPPKSDSIFSFGFRVTGANGVHYTSPLTSPLPLIETQLVLVFVMLRASNFDARRDHLRPESYRFKLMVRHAHSGSDKRVEVQWRRPESYCLKLRARLSHSGSHKCVQVQWRRPESFRFMLVARLSHSGSHKRVQVQWRRPESYRFKLVARLSHSGSHKRVQVQWRLFTLSLTQNCAEAVTH